MILSKKDLKTFLDADYCRFVSKPRFLDIILRNEKWYIWQYIIALRHVEYYLNNGKKHDLRFFFWWLRYKRLGFKMKYFIAPNSIGPGLMIYHVGDFIWVGNACKIGANCTLRPGVVFGRKTEKPTPDPVEVGDNCEFGVGARIIGSVRIGNNVSVGANAVVIHDIPDNSIAVGIPARAIKKRL